MLRVKCESTAREVKKLGYRIHDRKALPKCWKNQNFINYGSGPLVTSTFFGELFTSHLQRRSTKFLNFEKRRKVCPLKKNSGLHLTSSAFS